MKTFFAMMLTLALLTIAGAAMAEEIAAEKPTVSVPDTVVVEEFAAEKQKAMDAVKASLPDAVVDYAVREKKKDGGEWNLFFTWGDQIGMCKVSENTNEVHRVKLFKKEEGMLTASEVIAKLEKKKGALTVMNMELENDDGRITYEGDVRLDGKRYEFEMRATGRIVEWERD